MSNAGLQVFNDDGFVQIDQNYRNYALIAQGSFTTAGDPLVIEYPEQSTSLAPALFVKPASGVWVGGCVQGSLYAPDNAFTVMGSGSFSWRVYALDSTVTVDSATAGLQVFTDAGDIAFDSRCIMPRVKIGIAQSVPSSPTLPITITHSLGVIPWILVNSCFSPTYWGDENGAEWAARPDPSDPTNKIQFASVTSGGSIVSTVPFPGALWTSLLAI